ncbi:hypothetical protein Hypma_009274 [Hypsizygus marmoreus]|uniref:Uncharacterized protein n=1 Tax=Hypsizygus marmoreus TaxID=39966 RepID=A0A369JXV7_HYPMA|nr:hypothetical protein Hypma_009274 [Hypsizygus marmoreus]
MSLTSGHPSEPSSSKLLRFHVQSSDVIQDMRINVSEENSETVIWYKERFLSDDEIIEHVVHNPTSTICWTIHRPKRGWYIRMRSPSFAPGVFIPLIPVPQTSPQYVDAALSLLLRTNTPQSDFAATERQSISSTHSYPPTPPALVVQPPSPSSVHAKLEDLPGKKLRRLTVPATQLTQFILAPHSTQHVQPASSSIFARAFSALKNSRPSHSNSFTLSRVPATAPLSPPPPYASTSAISPVETSHLSPPTILSPPPVLVFHDRTPVLTVRSLTGLIELDSTEEELLGVETSFWIAVALTYLEFLEERESYLAALND